jgi:hypothetical protein
MSNSDIEVFVRAINYGLVVLIAAGAGYGIRRIVRMARRKEGRQ